MFGETEIQGQVRRAYQAQSQGLASLLHYAFQKALKVGKNVRHLFAMNRERVSLPALVWKIAESHVGSLVRAKILFIGYSEVNRSLLSLFRHRGVQSMILVTKEPTQLVTLPSDVHVKNYGFLAEWESCDLVISATERVSSSSRGLFLIDGRHSERREKSMATTLLLDLSVPRTINPALSTEPGIALLNIDDVMAMHSDLTHDSQQASMVFVEHEAAKIWRLFRKCS